MHLFQDRHLYGRWNELKFNNLNSSRNQEGPREWSEMIEHDIFGRDSQGIHNTYIYPQPATLFFL